MEVLVFQLLAPLSSWGEPAVGEHRGSASHPGLSALQGLLGAALGLQRGDDEAHAALRDGYGYAVGLLAAGRLLRDYHTAQMPPRVALKGRARATRRDELAVPKQALSTVLSTRDYRLDAASLVAVAQRPGAAPRWSLSELAAALRSPRYPLYLGRKSCPPAAPLWPQLVQAEDALRALQAFVARFEAARQAQRESDAARARWAPVPLEPLPALVRLHVDDHLPAGCPVTMSTPRKDRLIRRSGWQFGDRIEHLALLAEEE